MALPGDWPYLLGQQFLTAATSCGWACDRKYVADRCQPEGMPPGCPCQLVAVVSEGWLPDQQRNAGKCAAMLVAEVRLVLDLCQSPIPGQNEAFDPVKVNTAAQLQASARWAIMQGIRSAWKNGPLGVFPGEAPGACGRIQPVSAWRCTSSTGGATRWETLWRWSETLP